MPRWITPTKAPADEWSGDLGCGANYLSQQAVFRLAPAAGIAIDESLTLADRLASVQDKLAQGHEGARLIFETIGVYLGYALAHYADFYDLSHVLILGRVTSGDAATSSWAAAARCWRRSSRNWRNASP